MLSIEELKGLTVRHLQGWPEVVCMDEIIKGGSDRRFYRLGFEQAPTVILMTYTKARADNLRFVGATKQLRGLGVKVPEIWAHDEERMCVWLEDMGNVDIHAFRLAGWEVRRPLYEAALAEVAKLHGVRADEMSAVELAQMEPGFDEGLYGWEQEYFLTHFMVGIVGVKEVPVEVRVMLERLRKHLAVLPKGLVHRDYQSQNLMVREGGVWLIDYQGVRPGLGEYDVASLLLDPYVEMTEGEREELLGWYAALMGWDFAGVRERYVLCAAQRLMQALGAYGNLSLNLGKPQFAEHIPVAKARLRMICSQHEWLRPLGEWLVEVE